jgi:aminoglycoside 2'-N-acetyltransferase I
VPTDVPDVPASALHEVEVRLLASDELSDAVRTTIRTLMWASFDDFSEDDWSHGIGGVHVVAFDGGLAVGHASVVTRNVYVGDEVFVGGYLEAVAVDARYRGRGVGAAVVGAADGVVEHRHPVAALSTSEHRFYERLGWERWLGPTFVVDGDGGWRRTEDEDAGVMVLRPAGSPVSDLTVPIAVDDRSGDAW